MIFLFDDRKYANYHIHSTFSDGKNTPEEMVKTALSLGLKEIGFAEHSYIPRDRGYCLTPENRDEYKRAIGSLKKKYAGEIGIFCGIEQDYNTEIPAEGYDFVIGSVHFIQAGEELISVDERPELIAYAVERYFGGDYYAYTGCYFERVSKVAEVTGADIIGHLDLVTMYNEGNRLFDEDDRRYVRQWQQAADSLLAAGKAFEINSGSFCRGIRSVAYPAPDLERYIRERKGKFVYSGDSHSTDELIKAHSELCSVVV